MKRLPVALVAGLVLSLAATVQAQSNRVLEAEQLVHEEMAAFIPVDPEVARSKVPSDYELVLTPDGSAVLVFITKLATWTIPDRPPAETKEIHVYVQVQGPDQVIEVPGAPVTLPSFYYYNLFYDLDGPGWSVGQIRSYGFDVRKPEQLEIGPFGPMRSGSVVERGTQGQGYRWTEYTTPAPALYGQYNFFERDKNAGRHARAEVSQLFYQAGVGQIVLETDPGSSLADFGPLLFGITYDFVPAQNMVTIYNE